ncbi:tryptophan-rich sensory protein [Devosia pacifica]|uniref:Tryptophan-rich sensory protein n=1 Tax=Devosia pacifica TaxID=1335967 RepID=A0A918SEV0_9HYPH|nr:TspO/MBR family protein [Devosia pacifica]GHA35149.1 tryptophan-rich sensory protein [Devosia pacifica]
MSTQGLGAAHRTKKWIVYLLFAVGVILVGGLIGSQVQPGEWYRSLEKPPFNPPDWVFGPVWTILYAMIGVAGARIFLVNPRSVPMAFWVAQMVLNWAWTPLWFGENLIWQAFAVVCLLLIAIVGFIFTAWRQDRIAAWLFVPYLCWVAFAATLNLSIGLLN